MRQNKVATRQEKTKKEKPLSANFAFVTSQYLQTTYTYFWMSKNSCEMGSSLIINSSALHCIQHFIEIALHWPVWKQNLCFLWPQLILDVSRRPCWLSKASLNASSERLELLPGCLSLRDLSVHIVVWLPKKGFETNYGVPFVKVLTKISQISQHLVHKVLRWDAKPLDGLHQLCLGRDIFEIF